MVSPLNDFEDLNFENLKSFFTASLVYVPGHIRIYQEEC